MKKTGYTFRLLFSITLILFSIILKSNNVDIERTKPSKKKQSETFYDSLQTKASKRRFTKELYDLLIVNDGKSQKQAIKNHSYVISQKRYDGKKIRNITVQRIDVFGAEVYDLKREPSNFFERAGNKIHIKTSERIIRNHLILKEGEVYYDYKRSDNERILRNLPSINDVRIIVENVDNKNNTVDLLVIVKDVWSLGFNVAFTPTSIDQVDIWEKNLMGTGHEVSNSLIWKEQYPGETGYEGVYKINNMFGSFINVEGKYYSAFDFQGYSIDVTRNFYSPGTHYAGGILYERYQRNHKFLYDDVIDSTYLIDLEHTDAWLARAFKISNTRTKNFRSNFVISAGYEKYSYLNSLPVEEDLFYDYYTREMYLGGLSYSSQNFIKTNYFYSYGRTEDIPIGILASVIMGYEQNQFKDRYYTRLSLSAGYHHNKFGFLYNSFDLSFFTNSEGNMEQGAAQFKFDFYSNLIKMGRFRFRQFIKINYVTGFGRYRDESLSLDNSYGIRGFSTDSLRFPKKLVINTESILFTPFFFYGFQFVFYGFADVGFSGPIDKAVIYNRAYTGIGIGLRIRNDHLVFKTIQLRFSYYPIDPGDLSHNPYYYYSSEYRHSPPSFYVKKPQVFKFR